MFKEYKYSNNRKKPSGIILMVLVFLIIASALAWLIMILWNNILTDVAGLKPLNFWKAAGLLLLAKILFGGFRRKKSFSSGYSKRKHWKEKWMRMSPEERKEAKAKWRQHCQHRDSATHEEE